jgi:CelD/BcsL family acetyltransferase involved in cellulose biosynthesis
MPDKETTPPRARRAVVVVLAGMRGATLPAAAAHGRARARTLPAVQVSVVPVPDLPPAFIERWSRLAASALEPNPFHEPAMVLAAARHLAEARDARVVAVEDGDGLAAVLPLRPRRSYRRVPMPVLHDVLHPLAFLGTPLVRREAPEVALAALLEHLEQGARERWLVLETVPAEGPVRAALDAALAARRLPATGVLGFERPVLRRRPEPTYLDGRFDARRRKELRRQRRRLAEALGVEAGTTELAGGRPPAAVEGAIAAFLRLEAAGWKGREGTAVAAAPELAACFAAALTAFAADGRLRVWALGGGGREAAMVCGVCAGDTLFHLKTAYDEALAPASPGLLLELDLIEAFHRDLGTAWLDSCTDAGPGPSRRLYPDRRRLETLAIGLDRRTGAAATRLLRTRVRLGPTAPGATA